MKEAIKFLEEKFPNDGKFDTKISSLRVFRSSKTTVFTVGVYKPSLCVILKGEKTIQLGKDTLIYDENNFLISTTHLPAIASISKSPYLAIMLSFELDEILNTANEMKITANENSKKVKERSLFIGSLNDTLKEAITRVIMLLDKNEDERDFLLKLIKKEILYSLLNSSVQKQLLRYIFSNTIENKIARAINIIKSKYNETLNMDNLAKDVGISSSSLFHSFKSITALSPLQFQKRIRLEEAKQILTNHKVSINEVAFKVGYESPSQFSREYSRMFGISPKAHSLSLQN